jgi:putative hydrolase
MDTPFGPIDPEQFADTPLFREIQRVLTSSSGPINWELARQIGIAGAQEGRDDPMPGEAEQQGFEGAVRVAELQVARFTGLDAPDDVAPVQAVRIADWVSANTESLRPYLEPAADKVAAAIGEVSASALPPDVPPEMAAMGGVLRQLSPLLLGAQVGSVLGYLGQHVLGQYDVAVPRASPAPLLFVAANVARFERDWSLEPLEFRTYVALHEVAHRFEFARPWAPSRFGELLEDFFSTLRIDAEELGRKITTMDAADPEAMRSLLESEEGLFGAVLDDEQRIKLGRVQAFMAAAEGYAGHVTVGVARELLPTAARIEEAMRRHREDEQADPVFERLLGIDMKRELYAQGAAFCDAVVGLTDEATLARMWDSADALPSLPEIEEPRLWLARIV